MKLKRINVKKVRRRETVAAGRRKTRSKRSHQTMIQVLKSTQTREARLKIEAVKPKSEIRFMFVPEMFGTC